MISDGEFPSNLSYYTPSPPMSEAGDTEAVDREAMVASAVRASEVDTAALTQTTSSKRTRQNYTKQEILNLLRIMERIVPCDSDEWRAVADEHALHYVVREVEGRKKKFAQLHCCQAPTGDPNIPPEILLG